MFRIILLTIFFLSFINCNSTEHWELVDIDTLWETEYGGRKDCYDIDCYDADNCISIEKVDLDHTVARYSTDGGKSWTTCLQDNYIFDSNWVKIYCAPSPISVCYYSADLCTIMADSGYYYVSHDKCQTWDKYHLDTYCERINHVYGMNNSDFCDNEFGAAISSSKLFFTNDSSNSYIECTNLPQPDSLLIFDVVKVYDRDNIFLLCYSQDRDDYTIRTCDGGETWIEGPTLPHRASAIHLFSPLHILAVGGGPTKPNSASYRTVVQESFDGGQTWHINMDTLVWPRKRFIDVDFADSLNGLARGVYNNLWWTRDGGKTWWKDSSDFYANILWFPGMAYPRKDVAYFGSQLHGEIYKWTDDGINVTEPFPEPAGRLMLYPNPVEQGAPLYLRIQADMLPAPTVRMFDMEVRQAAPDFRPQAQGVYRLKTSGLAPGTYTVQLDCRAGTFTAKVIVR